MILIDSRIRDIEYKYLTEELNEKVEKLPLSNDVYEEISGHSDIFYAKINDEIYVAPNAKIIKPDFILGNELVEKEYPKDVKYNICQIGNNIIGSKYADSSLINKINIFVKQGYTKCSISVTSSNSCITSDKGIFKELQKHNIDVLYIQENNIHLLDKNGNISKMNGFIGGASAVINDTFILFGDINKFNEENQNKIREHLKKYNLKLKYFNNLDVVDYGGIIMYK